MGEKKQREMEAEKESEKGGLGEMMGERGGGRERDRGGKDSTSERKTRQEKESESEG